MNYTTHTSDCTELTISSFKQKRSEEIHLMCKPTTQLGFDQQFVDVIDAIDNYIKKQNIRQSAVVLFRFFVSDCANQMDTLTKVSEHLNEKHDGCAISIVQQPPLGSCKITAWTYIINNDTPLIKRQYDDRLEVLNGDYLHIYHTQLLAEDSSTDSHDQTSQIFNDFNLSLKNNNLTVKENCIRTWIYVKDVDYNYNGVVVSRRKLFDDLGMTDKTHFITSTGIEGRHFDYNHNVLMDAYSVGGITDDQVKFLTAPDYLNPTHEYGVTFERGTSVDFGDRRHIYLSGTASIDNKGEVVHEQQIEKQIERTLINVKELLRDAEATLDDLAQLIIYIRDTADEKVVRDYFEIHHIEVPKVLVLAPVCRPGWLIEMECIAIKSLENNGYYNF